MNLRVGPLAIVALLAGLAMLPVFLNDNDDETEDAADFFEVVEARFYLVPESTDWSSASWETQNEIPGVENFDGNQFAYDLADFEAANGLELLVTVDLRGLEPVASAITPPDSDGFGLSSGDVYATAPDALTGCRPTPTASP